MKRLLAFEFILVVCWPMGGAYAEVLKLKASPAHQRAVELINYLVQRYHYLPTKLNLIIRRQLLLCRVVPETRGARPRSSPYRLRRSSCRTYAGADLHHCRAEYGEMLNLLALRLEFGKGPERPKPSKSPLVNQRRLVAQRIQAMRGAA